VEKPIFDGKQDRDILIEVAIRQAIQGEKLESIDRHLETLNGTCATLTIGQIDHERKIREAMGGLKVMAFFVGGSILALILRMLGYL